MVYRFLRGTSRRVVRDPAASCVSGDGPPTRQRHARASMPTWSGASADKDWMASNSEAVTSSIEPVGRSPAPTDRSGADRGHDEVKLNLKLND